MLTDHEPEASDAACLTRDLGRRLRHVVYLAQFMRRENHPGGPVQLEVPTMDTRTRGPFAFKSALQNTPLGPNHLPTETERSRRMAGVKTGYVTIVRRHL